MEQVNNKNEQSNNSILDSDSQKNSQVQIDELSLIKIKSNSDFYLAIAGGALATLFGAILWAVVTVATEYQIGYMAIGIGFLVGYAVQFFGAGIESKFGFLGAGLALISCILGNLFSQIGFIANDEGMAYYETFQLIDFPLAIDIIIESIHPMDFLFYGFAVYQGYRVAFRPVTLELLSQLKNEDHDGKMPYHSLRLPLAIISLVVILGFFYFSMQGVNGHQIYYHDTGEKLSEGEIKDNKLEGNWQYYYPSGVLSAEGSYLAGEMDGLWIWYDPEGAKSKSGVYKNGLEEGTWYNYYANGNIIDSGAYVKGRLQGLWKIWYESGKINQIGNYDLNKPDGNWIIYYENGNISTTGSFVKGSKTGKWYYYNEDGSPNSESEINENEIERTINLWNNKGEQIVNNGNGFYQSKLENGTVVMEGKYRDGFQVGIWKTYSDEGELREIGEFKNEKYYIESKWDDNSKQTIQNGNGKFDSYFPITGNFYESGNVNNGLREGEWFLYYDSVNVVQSISNYNKGELSGKQENYHINGNLYSEGNLVNGKPDGKWNWYFESGYISSTVNFENGQKEGIQEIYSESGNLIREETYKSGELVSEKSL